MDTEGNNKCLGHYPGNQRQVYWPYRDCQCDFNDMSYPNPTCVYTTLSDMWDAKRLKSATVSVPSGDRKDFCWRHQPWSCNRQAWPNWIDAVYWPQSKTEDADQSCPVLQE